MRLVSASNRLATAPRRVLAPMRRHVSVVARPLPRRDAPELMDDLEGRAGPAVPIAELAANLRDIRRVNRFFGGTAVVLRHLPSLLDEVPPDQEAEVLDLATGSADIPLAIVRWARARGRTVRVVASDASPPILDAAARRVAREPAIRLARQDARAVPFPDRSFDVVLCSLALHHFPPDDAVAVLREMDRLARRGFIVNDLARGRLGYAGAWVASRLTTRNRLTRHDAPLSVLRAYTPLEFEGLLDQAGVEGAVVQPERWFRLAAVKRAPQAESRGPSNANGSPE